MLSAELPAKAKGLWYRKGGPRGLHRQGPNGEGFSRKQAPAADASEVSSEDLMTIVEIMGIIPCAHKFEVSKQHFRNQNLNPIKPKGRNFCTRISETDFGSAERI